MTACVDQQLLLGGLVDGELDAGNTALVEGHVARCADCREELERLHAVRNLLSREGVRHAAPTHLRDRIQSLPELAPPKQQRATRLPGWLAPGMAGALAASLAMVSFVQVPAEIVLDEQLVSSHVRSLQPGHLTDVQTTSKHIVKPWFNGRVDFAPPVPELAAAGFPLAGGRLDSINGRTVAVIVYHRRLHTVNLFVWPGDKGRSRSSSQDGFALEEWSGAGLRYAAVSDIGPGDLQQFRQAFIAATAQ